MYDWLLERLRELFQEVCLLKESPRGSVRLLRHTATGRRFILRHFTGNAEVYRKLLDYSCPNLPVTLEVASRGRNIWSWRSISGGTPWIFC